MARSDFVACHETARLLMKAGKPFTVSAYNSSRGRRYTGPTDRSKKPKSTVLYRLNVIPKVIK